MWRYWQRNVTKGRVHGTHYTKKEGRKDREERKEKYLIIVDPNKEEKRGIASVHSFIVPMLHKWALNIIQLQHIQIQIQIGIGIDLIWWIVDVPVGRCEQGTCVRSHLLRHGVRQWRDARSTAPIESAPAYSQTARILYPSMRCSHRSLFFFFFSLVTYLPLSLSVSLSKRGEISSLKSQLLIWLESFPCGCSCGGSGYRAIKLSNYQII